MLLTREYSDQLKESQPKTIEDVPGLDCDVRIRPLIGIERVEFYSKAQNKATDIDDEMVAGFVRMVVLVIDSVIDENGDLVYSIDDFDHVAKLDQGALMHISDQASRLNGFDTGDLEENS